MKFDQQKSVQVAVEAHAVTPSGVEFTHVLMDVDQALLTRLKLVHDAAVDMSIDEAHVAIGAAWYPQASSEFAKLGESRLVVCSNGMLWLHVYSGNGNSPVESEILTLSDLVDQFKSAESNAVLCFGVDVDELEID